MFSWKMQGVEPARMNWGRPMQLTTSPSVGHFVLGNTAAGGELAITVGTLTTTNVEVCFDDTLRTQIFRYSAPAKMYCSRFYQLRPVP
jgi:hypothetical protein